MQAFRLPLPTPQSTGESASVLIATSGIAALLGGLYAGEPLFREAMTWPALGTSPWLEFLDPYIWHALAAGHVVFVLALWHRLSAGHSRLRAVDVIAPLSALVILLVGYYVLNDLVYKVTLDRPRPPESIRIVFGPIGRFVSPVTGGAPSGFASRSMFFTLLTALAALDVKRLHPVGAKLPLFAGFRSALLLQLVLTAIVCTVRVLSGYHYWFDMVVGLVLGVYTFWLTMLAVGSGAARQLGEPAQRSLAPLTVSLFVCLALLGFSYCRSAEEWVPVVLVALAATAVSVRNGETTT